MGREHVGKNELQSYLESELHKFGACNGYRVSAVTKLETPDAEGCNWVPKITLASDGKKPRDPCASIAERIVAQARKRFNLA